jgi:streptomycin 6-kinase
LPLPAPLPNHLRRTVLSVWRAEGPAWLEALPALVDECAERWSLTNLSTPFRLSCNYVLAADSSRGPVVLKLGVPRDDMVTEALSLVHYASAGAVPVIEAEPERGILLMERVRPGRPLLDLAAEDDVKATELAIDVFRRWRRPPPNKEPFPTLEHWGRAFASFRATFESLPMPIEADLLDLGERLFFDLAASSGPRVLLHGDLHHDNILSSDTGLPWRVIDPKGVLGEAEYEVSTFLGNPDPQLAGKEPGLLERRIRQFADGLGYDRERLRDWGIAYHVMSAVWSLEDGAGDGAGAIATARALASIRF